MGGGDRIHEGHRRRMNEPYRELEGMLPRVQIRSFGPMEHVQGVERCHMLDMKQDETERQRRQDLLK